MARYKALHVLLTIASLATAQSADPGLGINPDAEGATEEVTPGTGPNGSQEWFNTGIDSDGWTPPFLNFSSLLYIDRPTFYSGAGLACGEYNDYFQTSGDRYNIDPAILAFVAMQGSSCNPYATGTRTGLMHVSCDKYTTGFCTDYIQDNVDAGANYLRNLLESSGNNAIETLATYSGWFTAGSSGGRRRGRHCEGW